MEGLASKALLSAEFMVIEAPADKTTLKSLELIVMESTTEPELIVKVIPATGTSTVSENVTSRAAKDDVGNNKKNNKIVK